MFNMKHIDEEQIEVINENLNEDKETIFLLVGKTQKINLTKENNDLTITKKLEKLIINKFAIKSDIINMENLKKIKTILSNNNLIKEEIIFPNEIYK